MRIFTACIRIAIINNFANLFQNNRSKALNISHSFDKDTICFTLEKPCNISVEINANIDHAVLLFAIPLENDIPDSYYSQLLLAK